MKRQRDASRRLLQALDLHAAGVTIMRENLRRRHPRISRTGIERALAAWLAKQPANDDRDMVAARWPRRR